MIFQNIMVKKVASVVLAFSALSGCSFLSNSPPGDKAQNIVDNSKKTVCRFQNIPQDRVATAKLFKNAKGVVVLPLVVRGGYIGGVDVGSGTLITKGNSGQWGYPSFYSVSNLSIGLQAGLENTEMVLFLMSNKAVQSIIKDQFRFGADAGLSFAIWGAGAEGATTTNKGADVVMLNYTKFGLYGGVSLKSGSLIRRKDLNEGYYSAGASPITINQRYANQNAGAEGLRAALSNGC